jgi:hypothetical protein
MTYRFVETSSGETLQRIVYTLHQNSAQQVRNTVLINECFVL